MPVSTPPRRSSWRFPIALALICSATACAALEPARMALPAGLDAAAAETLEGVSAGRQGGFTLGAHRGRFTRGADQLTLLERLRQDKASVSFTLEPAAGAAAGAAPSAGRCDLRARSVGGSAVEVPLGRGTVDCRFELPAGGTARLDLEASRAAAGTRDERRGHLSVVEGAGAAELRLQVRSVHRVEGSPLPLEAPIGYAFFDGDRAVGAVEINGRRARVWRPPTGQALHEAVTRAAIALALLWDPAQQP